MTFTPFTDATDGSSTEINSRLTELQATLSAYSGISPGQMIYYPMNAVPSGWLECDGSLVSRSTYANLFAAIGTTFGVGDGTTTFGLPDCRGRVLIGQGTGSGLSARTIGQSLGAETHQVTVPELPAHTHGGTVTLTPQIQSGSGSSSGTSGNSTSAGNDQAHPNVQPSFALKVLIKV